MAAKKPYFRNLFEELGICRDDVLQFSFGAPSSKMLESLGPVMVEATQKCLESSQSLRHIFQYGALRGDPVFIEGLSQFLSKKYYEPVHSDDLICTTGATMGTFLAISLFLKPGDYVFVEDPTYFIMLRILQEELEVNVLTVPADEDGIINVDGFDAMLREYREKLGATDEQRPYRAIFYTVPVFNNPTGKTVPEGKCKALINVLRKHDILAVCDDVYNIVHFEDGPPPRRLFAYDTKTDADYKGHVISSGSFSKFVAPGMRLGWLEAPTIVVNRITRSWLCKSGGGMNQYTSAIMGTALKHDIISKYIEDTIQTYKEKMEAMCEALDRHMSEFIKYSKPKGGFFIWVELNNNCDVVAFQRYCVINHKVDFRPGSSFSVNGNFKNCIRLSFAHVDLDKMDQGIKELAEALQNFLKQ